MARIVSLLPSATEIICALGLEEELVARSHECDHPKSVERLPAITEPKFKPEGTSGEIDKRVREIVAQSLSVYRVDAEQLRALAPDFIVTQSQCEVCAVSIGEVERAVADWTGARPTIVSLAPAALSDVLGDIQRVAGVLGIGESGRDIVAGLRARMDAIAARAHEAKSRPRVACIEWIEPLMAAGNWMPELVEAAGGVNLFGEAGKHSPWMTIDQLVASEPDVILIAPCGFGIEQTLANLPALTADSRWRSLCAIRERGIFVADGNQYFNRPGPRIVESLEILAEVVHPELFRFGHEGYGWRRL